MRLVGLVSSYREGALVRECVRSALDACDSVLIFEGPVGEGHTHGEESDFTEVDGFAKGRAVIRHGKWASDAAKRTAMLQWVRARIEPHHTPTWGLWLDADEVILWGHFLKDILARVTDEDEEHFNWLMKLVEMDGSVVDCSGKCLRLDKLDHYVTSSYEIAFRSTPVTMALPNVPSETAPYQGLPHLLHRSPLRPKGRDAPELRLHMEEAKLFPAMLEKAGLRGVA